MPTGNDYELAARELASKVGEGLISMDEGELRAALRLAGNPRARLGKHVRKALEKALHEEGIHVHPTLKDTSIGTYRLYHKDGVLAFLNQRLDLSL